MKKGIFLSLVLILAMTVNIGCEALDVTEEVTFEITLIAKSNTPNFVAETLLDADSLSSTIAEYKDKIKDIEALEVTFQITEVRDSSASKIMFATLSVGDEFGEGMLPISSVNNQEIATMPTPIPLPLEQDGLTRFEELMTNSPHRALVKFFGSVDGYPVDFTVVFKFRVKMTANPI